MTTLTAKPMQPRASALPNYIAGGWREAAAVDALDDRNPATGDVLARVPLSGADDVRAAAREAFPAWRSTSVLVRARAVFALRDKLYAEGTTFGAEERERLIKAYLPKRLIEAGLLARPDDRGDAVLHIAPPLISDAALLDDIVGRMGDVLEDAQAHMGVGAQRQAAY